MRKDDAYTQDRKEREREEIREPLTHQLGKGQKEASSEIRCGIQRKANAGREA